MNYPTCITNQYGTPENLPTVAELYRSGDGWTDCENLYTLTPRRVLNLHLKGVEVVSITFTTEAGFWVRRSDFRIAELLPWARRHILDGVNLEDCEALVRLHRATGSEKVWKALKAAAADSVIENGEGWDSCGFRVYQAMGINRNGRQRWRSYRKTCRTFTQTR